MCISRTKLIKVFKDDSLNILSILKFNVVWIEAHYMKRYENCFLTRMKTGQRIGLNSQLLFFGTSRTSFSSYWKAALIILYWNITNVYFFFNWLSRKFSFFYQLLDEVCVNFGNEPRIWLKYMFELWLYDIWFLDFINFTCICVWFS